MEHRAELVAILKNRFRDEPRDRWIERLLAHGVPAGPVWSIDEALKDPYVQESEILARLTP